jgi:SAM-dependent methyltransferase
VSPLRFHEIAEAHHRIQNPFTEEQLMLLGDLCGLHEATRQLDLACGKGEMLCRWAERYGLAGVGVDISEVFIEAAQARAHELEVWPKLNFVVGDAADYPQPFHEFNIVSCIGATWIGGGLVGTLELMLEAAKDNTSLLLVGEPYWIEPPPEEAYSLLAENRDTFSTLDGTLDRFESLGLELVEMVLANPAGWDRYEAQQWQAVDQFLLDNPDDPDADELYQWLAHNRRIYLTYGRRYFGWGVFVLRANF